MSWWPNFAPRTEHRESSFTDALVQQILAQASGGSTAAATATGALEAASGIVARCFAAATVDGPAHLTAALTPGLMSTIGRALIRKGELVLAIDVDMDGLARLLPAADWDVTGYYDPSTWAYRVNLAGPSRYTTRASLPAAAVVHPRYQVDPERPWRGVGPLQSATLAGRLSAENRGGPGRCRVGTTGQCPAAASGRRGSDRGHAQV